MFLNVPFDITYPQGVDFLLASFRIIREFFDAGHGI
jgi:hypothetical protein